MMPRKAKCSHRIQSSNPSRPADHERHAPARGFAGDITTEEVARDYEIGREEVRAAMAYAAELIAAPHARRP